MRYTFRIDRNDRQAAVALIFSTARSVRVSEPTSKRFKNAAILQGDDNLVGIVDDVFVGQDIAALIHDHAGAQRQLIMAGAVQARL
jgi:hypothetical protein